MENLIPIPQGGAQKRPGTKYIAEVKTSSLSTRIIPFEFSTSQSYVVEVGNQYMRFYTNNAQILSGDGTEDLSAIGNLVGHWLLNDAAANQTVLDDDGGTHNGATLAANTEDISETGKVGSGCFALNGTEYVIVTDHADFTFSDAGAPGSKPFSVAAWIYVTDQSNSTIIVSKWDAGAATREWRLFSDSGTTNNSLLSFEHAISAIPTSMHSKRAYFRIGSS